MILFFHVTWRHPRVGFILVWRMNALRRSSWINNNSGSIFKVKQRLSMLVGGWGPIYTEFSQWIVMFVKLLVPAIICRSFAVGKVISGPKLWQPVLPRDIVSPSACLLPGLWRWVMLSLHVKYGYSAASVCTVCTVHQCNDTFVVVMLTFPFSIQTNHIKVSPYYATSVSHRILIILSWIVCRHFLTYSICAQKRTFWIFLKIF